MKAYKAVVRAKQGCGWYFGRVWESYPFELESDALASGTRFVELMTPKQREGLDSMTVVETKARNPIRHSEIA